MGRVGKYLGLVLCILGAAVYAAFAVRSYAAFRQSTQTEKTAAARRATELEPRNASYHALLSRDLLVAESDPAKSINEAKLATDLDPYDAAYWLDLALAYHSSGMDKDAEFATRRAIEVDPKTPDVAWNAGGLFLLASDPEAALHEFAVVMGQSPKRLRSTLELCWRVTPDVAAIERILPRQPDASLEFMRMLTGQHDTAAAEQAWQYFLALNADFDYHSALFYVDYLLEEHDVSGAVAAWNALAAKSKVLASYSAPDNLVINSNFEHDILNAGFGWHYEKSANIHLALRGGPTIAADHSLCIIYDGPNGDAGIHESVAVSSNTEYLFSVRVRSDNLETANGPSVALTDGYSDAALASTARTSGTSDWHMLEQRFVTGSKTELISIGVKRDPMGTFVRGRFCLADPVIRAVR